jgi:hypothetical protein
MPNRLLKEGVLDRFFSLFLKAKSQNKESQWLQRLRKDDPELADIWSQWDTDMNDVVQNARKMLKNSGNDTSKIDAVIQKYN